MNYFVRAFIVVLAYRILFCLSGYIRATYYERKYKEYIAGKGEEFASYTAASDVYKRQVVLGAVGFVPSYQAV